MPYLMEYAIHITRHCKLTAFGCRFDPPCDTLLYLPKHFVVLSRAFSLGRPIPLTLFLQHTAQSFPSNRREPVLSSYSHIFPTQNAREENSHRQLQGIIFHLDAQKNTSNVFYLYTKYSSLFVFRLSLSPGASPPGGCCPSPAATSFS